MTLGSKLTLNSRCVSNTNVGQSLKKESSFNAETKIQLHLTALSIFAETFYTCELISAAVHGPMWIL